MDAEQFRKLMLDFSFAIGSEFFFQDPCLVANALIGKFLVSKFDNKLTAGRIVETEAYLSNGDSACHGATKITPKNHVMFGPAGFSYVYAIHAKWCFNVVTEGAGEASAVLIRAVEPIIGLDTMASRRGTRPIREFCRGPGKLCDAFGINKKSNGVLLGPKNNLWISDYCSQPTNQVNIVKTPRIGVTSAKELLLRFVLAESVYASGPKYLNR